MNGVMIGGSGHWGSSAVSYEEVKKPEYNNDNNSAKHKLTVNPHLPIQSVSEHDTFFRHIENNLEMVQDRAVWEKM